MPDIVSPEKRSHMMSGIRGKNTLPEMTIRKGLHARGFRYRLHDTKLPGKPDLVFPVYNAVIFVHGCFWHKHHCHLFKWPSSRQDFWKEKITRNAQKDIENLAAIQEKGIRVLTIWECTLKGKTRLPMENVIEQADQWLRSGKNNYVIEGFTGANC